MATYRNIKFYGFAYGSDPVTVDVRINNTQVYLNTVTTTPGDIPYDLLDTLICDQVLFEVNGTTLFPVTFSGSYPHSISVSGGNGIVISAVESNYMAAYIQPGGAVEPGSPTSYHDLYNGTPVNSDNSPDVRSSVAIDGVLQVPIVGSSLGLWTWAIEPGSNLTCNLNVSLGNVAN